MIPDSIHQDLVDAGGNACAAAWATAIFELKVSSDVNLTTI